MLRSRLARQGLVLSAAALTGVLAQQALAEVPVALASSTVKAAMLIATGQSLVAGAVSTQAAILTQGVLKAMLITKLKIASLVLVAGGVAATGSAVAVRHMLAADSEKTPAPAQAQPAPRDDDQSSAINDTDEKLDPAQARAESTKNMKVLGLAMHEYYATTGSFPPAALFSADDKPLLSWRVLLLPHIGQKKLYEQFKLDEPWDSVHNKPLLAKMPEVYAAPGLRRKYPDATFWQVFTGKGTVFEGRQGTKLEEITDGTANTALIVEAGVAVPWTKPVDLPFVAKKPLPELGGMSQEGFLAVFADGAAHILRKDAADADLRPIITPRGGEVVDFQRLTP